MSSSGRLGRVVPKVHTVLRCDAIPGQICQIVDSEAILPTVLQLQALSGEGNADTALIARLHRSLRIINNPIITGVASLILAIDRLLPPALDIVFMEYDTFVEDLRQAVDGLDL